MLNNSRYFFLFLIFSTQLLSAQTEQLRYTVYYHWGPVWIDGGDLFLSYQEDVYREDTAIKLIGKGVSDSKWNWLFKVNDNYTSWCRKDDFLPLKSIKDAYEAGEKTDNNYLFDYKNLKAYIETKAGDIPVKHDTIELNKPIYDAQCATAYLRFLDFDSLQNRDTVLLNILLDGELYLQQFLVYKNFWLQDESGKLHKVVKFTAVMPENKLFSSKEAIRVWVTDDEKRLPLKIKADLKVGSIEVLYNDIRFKKPQN